MSRELNRTFKDSRRRVCSAEHARDCDYGRASFGDSGSFSVSCGRRQPIGTDRRDYQEERYAATSVPKSLVALNFSRQNLTLLGVGDVGSGGRLGRHTNFHRAMDHTKAIPDNSQSHSSSRNSSSRSFSNSSTSREPNGSPMKRFTHHQKSRRLDTYRPGGRAQDHRGSRSSSGSSWTSTRNSREADRGSERSCSYESQGSTNREHVKASPKHHDPMPPDGRSRQRRYTSHRSRQRRSIHRRSRSPSWRDNQVDRSNEFKGPTSSAQQRSRKQDGDDDQELFQPARGKVTGTSREQDYPTRSFDGLRTREHRNHADRSRSRSFSRSRSHSLPSSRSPSPTSPMKSQFDLNQGLTEPPSLEPVNHFDTNPSNDSIPRNHGTPQARSYHSDRHLESVGTPNISLILRGLTPENTAFQIEQTIMSMPEWQHHDSIRPQFDELAAGDMGNPHFADTDLPVAVRLLRDRTTGRSRCIAVVRFPTVEASSRFTEAYYPAFPISNSTVRFQYAISQSCDRHRSHQFSSTAAERMDNHRPDRQPYNYNSNHDSWRNRQHLAKAGHPLATKCSEPHGSGGSTDFEDSKSRGDSEPDPSPINDGSEDISDKPTKLLLLRGLDPLTTVQSLLEALENAGLRLKEVREIRDKANGLSWGYGFAEAVGRQAGINNFLSNQSVNAIVAPLTEANVAPKTLASAFFDKAKANPPAPTLVIDGRDVTVHFGKVEAFISEYAPSESSFPSLEFRAEDLKVYENGGVPSAAEFDTMLEASKIVYLRYRHSAAEVGVAYGSQVRAAMAQKTESLPGRHGCLSYSSLPRNLSVDEKPQAKNVSTAPKISEQANFDSELASFYDELGMLDKDAEDLMKTGQSSNDASGEGEAHEEKREDWSRVFDPRAIGREAEDSFVDYTAQWCLICDKRFDNASELRQHLDKGVGHARNIHDSRKIERARVRRDAATKRGTQLHAPKGDAMSTEHTRQQPQVDGATQHRSRSDILENQPRLSQNSVGGQMLAKMGWTGGGLGKHGTGITEPVNAQRRGGFQQGLGNRENEQDMDACS